MNNSLVECVLPKSCPYVPMCLFFVLLPVRWACADTTLPPDAGAAAAPDEEAAAATGCSSPAESRAATTRADHSPAEGRCWMS